MRLIRDREVRAALVSGLIIAAMAMIGADRYPVACAVVATVWVVVTTAIVIHTTRRADRSPGTGAWRSHDHGDDLPGEDVVDMSEHTVRAKRWSGGWELHIGDVGVTQSRTLATAERQVRGFLGALLDADVSGVTVTIVPELGDLTERIALARAHAADAARAQRDATAESRTLVREMRAAGLSLADIAAIMHVSTGRIAQLTLPDARAILGNLGR